MNDLPDSALQLIAQNISFRERCAPPSVQWRIHPLQWIRGMLLDYDRQNSHRVVSGGLNVDDSMHLITLSLL